MLQSPKVMEALTNLAKNSQEGEDKREKSGVCSSFLVLAIAIPMVVIGTLNQTACVYSSAALFLMVNGGIGIGSSFTKIWIHFTRGKFGMDEAKEKMYKNVLMGLDLGHFITIIWGAIVVFGEFKISISNKELSFFKRMLARLSWVKTFQFFKNCLVFTK